jgi:putative lipoprotein
MKRLFLPLLCLSMFAHAEAERLPYTCDNGSRVEISFSASAEGRRHATLHFSDSELTLPQVAAVSGISYRQDGIGLHTNDRQAIFEDGKGNMRRCQLGNEPPAGSQPTLASSSFIDLQGTISFPPNVSLPGEAKLILRVQDRRQRGSGLLTLAEQTIALNQPYGHIPFMISIDRDLLGKNSRPFITASIEYKGKRKFNEDKIYPALGHGASDEINITLIATGTRRK